VFRSDGILSFKMSASRTVFSIIRFGLQAHCKLYRIIEKNEESDKFHIHLTNRIIKLDSFYSRYELRKIWVSEMKLQTNTEECMTTN